MAIILNHPKHRTIVTAEATRVAREDQWRRLAEHEAIRELAARVGGWRRLATLVRNLAHYDGIEVR